MKTAIVVRGVGNAYDVALLKPRWSSCYNCDDSVMILYVVPLSCPATDRVSPLLDVWILPPHHTHAGLADATSH